MSSPKELEGMFLREFRIPSNCDLCFDPPARILYGSHPGARTDGTDHVAWFFCSHHGDEFLDAGRELARKRLAR